jgi:cell wall-associated NlpC family hydrolase
MAVDGLADIQARIQQIQQQFAAVGGSASSTSSSTSSSSGTTDAKFADLLAAASNLGTDTSATGDATSGSSALSNLLSQGLSGTSNRALASYDPSSLRDAITALGAQSAGSTTTTTATSGANQRFLQNALAQTGDRYVWGASASPTDPNPTAFDCSELVKWAAKRAGVDLPDGSWQQYLALKQAGTTIPVQQALQTPGALLFSFSSEPTPGGGRPSHAHVAISLGNGMTIEARGKNYGVGSFSAANRFNDAALVPGLTA